MHPASMHEACTLGICSPPHPPGIRSKTDISSNTVPSRIDPILSSAMEHTVSTLLSQPLPSSSSRPPPLRVAQLEGCFAGKVCDELLRTSEGSFDLARFHALIGSFRDAISDACYGSASGAARRGEDDAPHGEGAVLRDDASAGCLKTHVEGESRWISVSVGDVKK